MEDNITICGTESISDSVWIKTEVEDVQYNEHKNSCHEEPEELYVKKENPDHVKKIRENKGLQTCSTEIKQESEIFLSEDSNIEGICSRNFVCHYCNKPKKSLNSLEIHIKENHFREKVQEEEKKKKKRRKSWLTYRRYDKKRKKGLDTLYPCPFCDYFSKYLGSLRDHVLGVHTDAKPYRCKLCSYSSAYARSLRTHIQAVHCKLKSHRCRRCNFSTAYPSHLKLHNRTAHLSVRSLHCPLCRYRTATLSCLKVHVMSQHGTLPFICSDCGYATARSSELRLHILNLHNCQDKPYRCPYCPFISAQTQPIKAHIRIVHMNNLPHICPYCPFSAALPLILEAHISSFHSDEVKNDAKPIQTNAETDNVSNNFLESDQSISHFAFQTMAEPNDNIENPICDSVDHSQSSYSSEMDDPLSVYHEEKTEVFTENIHEGDTYDGGHLNSTDSIAEINLGNSGPEIMQVALNPFDYALGSGFEEPEVSTLAKKKRKRTRNRNRDIVNQEKQYPCPQCDTHFQKLKHLMFHMKVEHPGVKSFPCTQCDFTAPKSSLLKYHVQAVHKAAAGAQVYQCPKCPYCTLNPEKLSAHIRVKHNRIRPYKCPHCSYSSTQAGHIKIHVRAKHTTEKPYHCTYCGYQSAYASALKSHITKRHTNN